GLMSRLLVQGLAEVDRPAHVDQEGMSACSIHSPAEWGGGDAASNSAAKRSYRHSCSPPVVYYRQSEPVYLVKNCADNATVPITRRSHVAGDCRPGREQLHLRPVLSVKTVALYTQDARRFATWVQQEHPGLKV